MNNNQIEKVLEEHELHYKISIDAKVYSISILLNVTDGKIEYVDVSNSNSTVRLDEIACIALNVVLNNFMLSDANEAARERLFLKLKEANKDAPVQ